jgi:uncharacterized protein DUF4956
MALATAASPIGSRRLGSALASVPALVTRVVHRFTYPAERPVVSLSLYYLALAATTALTLWLVPGLRPVVSGERLAALGAEGSPFTSPTAQAGAWLSWQFTLLLGVAMLGAFLLLIPTSWVYMATRRRKGFDQSVVQTMLILALSVAGVVVIVRNSLALAFSLAGIVGAVRFRNTLPDTRDTLYVFLSIAVGLAAGVEALGAAFVLSAVFNYVILLMWRADYGMCELGRPAGHLLLTAADGGDASAGNGQKEKLKDRKKGAADFNAVLLVRARAGDPGRRIVEPFLAREVKRWRLAEIETNGSNGEAVLKYLVRLGRKRQPGDVEDALLSMGGPDVIGARIH